jgi:thiol-disulfide isomerase/thioredoxin
MLRRTVFILLLMSTLGSYAHGAMKAGDPAPSFSLRDGEGRDFYLTDIVGEKSKEKGNGVILSFFASWCAPCRLELPIINSFVDELKGKGIKVVLVALKEDFDVIVPLLAELKVDKPVVLSDQYGKTAEKYQVRFLPTTFFIDSDGKVRDIIFGEIKNERALRESVGRMSK